MGAFGRETAGKRRGQAEKKNAKLLRGRPAKPERGLPPEKKRFRPVPEHRPSGAWRPKLHLAGGNPETTSEEMEFWRTPGGKARPGEKISRGSDRKIRPQAAGIRTGEFWAPTTKWAEMFWRKRVN